MNPLRLGRWLVVIGGLLTLIGLVTGFTALVSGAASRIPNLLGLAPIGVLIAFSGTILVVLTEPRGPAPPPETPPADSPESPRSSPHLDP